NAQTTLLAEALTSASVPYRVRGAGRLLEQPEVIEALKVLRRAPTLEVGLADLDHDVLHSDRLTEERSANVAEIVRLGREHMALVPAGDISAFMAWLTTTLRDEDRGSGDAVDIVTFHAAKGLEWPIVHIAGLEEGYVPIHHAETLDDTDEERRLLYVALTRARDELHCSWARKRTFGSRTMNRSPSPWVDAIETTLGVAPTQVSRARGAERARAARRSVPKSGAPAAGPERALFDALKAWRRDQSRAADVPAFVIFNDATLTAIAKRRPTSQAQLLGVSGVGPVKAQRFGAEVLRIVDETPG
ncbi:MAG TPA: 3'-5' exonuclease, partial [Microthrixaceae bacterium]|nr:3'-5' exonuclease [Microthrixaceae bacterium]